MRKEEKKRKKDKKPLFFKPNFEGEFAETALF
jgi:hypothetical protein